MSELPRDNKASDDVIAPIPQVAPKDHPHLEWMKKEISEEINRQISNVSDSIMSDSTISKDWIERKTSELDNKIEMEKVKSDAKFEKLLLQSDIKFEKLVGDIKQSESTHTKWMVGIAFSLISFTIAAIGVSTSILLKALPDSQDTHVVQPVESNTNQQKQKETATPDKLK